MARKGILGQKLGMTQVWDDQNRAIPVTVIQAGPCRVVSVKTPERDGYSAVQLSFGDVKPRRVNRGGLESLRSVLSAGRGVLLTTLAVSRSSGSGSRCA